MKKLLLNIEMQITISDKKCSEIGLADGVGEVEDMNSSHPRKTWSGKEEKLGEFILRNTFRNNSRLLMSAKAQEVTQ